MYKIFLRIILIAIIIIFFSVIYLSTVGVKTVQFNSLIKQEISKIDPRLKTELKDVSLILDLKDKQIKSNTKNTKLYLDQNLIELSEINLNIDIFSFYKKKYIIKNLEISTKKNELKDFLNFIKSYKFNIPTILLENKVKSGYINSNIIINFDQKNGEFIDYEIIGQIKQTKLNIIKNESINNINFKFYIKDQEFVLKNINFENKKINIDSDKIVAIKKGKKYFIQGSFKNKKTNINPKFFNNLINLKLEEIIQEELIIETKNQFNFLINEKLKIKNFNIKSNLKFEKVALHYNIARIKDYISDYNNLIILKNGNVDFDYSKNNISFKGNGKYSLGKNFDDFKLSVTKTKDVYEFDSLIEINNSPIYLKAINYTKKKEIPSLFKIKGSYLKNNIINLKKISYIENKNFFEINKFKINQNFKILDVNKIKINYLNKEEKLNNLIIKKNNKKYILSGDSLDSSKLIEDLLKEKRNKRILQHFKDLNSILEINIKKVILDEKNYLINLNGNVEFKKNMITNVNLISKFPNKDQFSFSVKSNNNNEKVTTLYTDNAEPFVNKFKFIKGFQNGKIDFYSVSNNNVSRSNIKIFDFKVKEVPALATLLSLASLQGIADLMTGEGIRFDEFEMNFVNKKNLMTIDEIYSIGPAISILMKGYIVEGELISLRGTLVPATTINKTIGSIPILGKILVGKKTGEGVFGVSFKIKGPPKELKTTVNPVKTLTPRFITRTLEKIKNN